MRLTPEEEAPTEEEERALALLLGTQTPSEVDGPVIWQYIMTDGQLGCLAVAPCGESAALDIRASEATDSLLADMSHQAGASTSSVFPRESRRHSFMCA